MTQVPKDLTHLTVLATFAHPDDEGFGFGGSLAMLAARGARITLVCATNGDVGEISDPSLATPENLHQVRQEELRQAMKVTGVQDVRFLDYRDSGMDGTPDNDHPRSLYQAPPDDVVARLIEIIREVRPNVVFTHDPTGGYGHPDHITVHHRTVQAFEAAGDVLTGDVSDANQSWTPQFLYYVCFPRSTFRTMWERMVELGIEPPFASLEADKIGSPDEAITTTMDMSSYVDTKIASLACHKTQMTPDGPFRQLPEELMQEIMSTEYFTLAVSQGDDAGTDLLAGLA
ncbi:MAG: hypothetical protein BZY80_00305 [SAR202 cluster bacterium Io17-Chloro-G2]|nr:MAG: hypothetical protein BZY80_00305 [SAR202 cluster bacterium Io17-Chloro-G2]